MTNAALACLLCFFVVLVGGPSAGYAAIAIGLMNWIMFPVNFTLTLDRLTPPPGSDVGYALLRYHRRRGGSPAGRSAGPEHELFGGSPGAGDLLRLSAGVGLLGGQVAGRSVRVQGCRACALNRDGEREAYRNKTECSEIRDGFESTAHPGAYAIS